MLPGLRDGEGRAYTTPNPPSTGSTYQGGIAISPTGQIHTTPTLGATDVYANGFRVSALGQLVIAPGGAIVTFQEGIPRTADSAVVVQTNVTPGVNDPFVGGLRIGALGGVYINSGVVVLPPDVPPSPGPFLTPDQQFFARLSVQPSAPRKALYTTLIDSLAAAGVWDKLDALYLCVSESDADTDTALTNLKQAAFKATLVGTPGFTASGGFTSSAVGNYVDSNYIPLTAGGNLVLNSGSVFYWGTAAAPGVGDPFAAYGVNASVYMILNYEGVYYANINEYSVVTFPSTDGSGFGLASRESAASVSVYHNGQYVFDTGESPIELPEVSAVMLSGPGYTTVYPGAILCAGIGGGLNATEQLALYNAVHTFLQATAGVP